MLPRQKKKKVFNLIGYVLAIPAVICLKLNFFSNLGGDELLLLSNKIRQESPSFSPLNFFFFSGFIFT